MREWEVKIPTADEHALLLLLYLFQLNCAIWYGTEMTNKYSNYVRSVINFNPIKIRYQASGMKYLPLSKSTISVVQCCKWRRIWKSIYLNCRCWCWHNLYLLRVKLLLQCNILPHIKRRQIILIHLSLERFLLLVRHNYSLSCVVLSLKINANSVFAYSTRTRIAHQNKSIKSTFY